ncbi:MAG: glycosyltransferase, partial [Pseudomonadota bacterium]
FSTASRLANANWAASGATEHFCFPQSFDFPYLQGTNASFRRSALLEVGGFDEEIEFYLDETELCCRLVDAGFIIRQLNSAWVHHKFAPSHVRDEHKITRYRYPVIKNKIYFSLKHGRPFHSVQEIIEDNMRFSSAHEADIRFHIDGGRLQTAELEKFKDENARAWERGLARGMSDSFELLTPEKLDRYFDDFKKFQPITVEDPKAMIFVCKDFPPQHAGGIATFNKHLAEAAAAEGHIVHVITRSDDINRVDFEHGVWVHRMRINSVERSEDAANRNIPQHIWDWSATALEEARRIATHRPIDIVEAPIWDCEGIAFLLEGDWPLVTSLQTTLRFFLDYHPELKADDNWMTSFGHPMIEAERALVMQSEALRAISGAIRREVERAYDCVIADERVTITPLGMPDAPVPKVKQDETSLNVLFVGRLEPRKGIDTLLEAVPLILAQHPNVRFRIIGDDSLHIPGGDITYKQAFLADETTASCRQAITFEGRVDNDRLFDAYESCDIFVAPSRFESFGLIFLEAMRVGKPVIGCCSGGIPEIVADGDNGFLTIPGNVRDLADAIAQLVKSASLRERMGRRSLEIFNERFTSNKMAEHNRKLIAQVGRNAKQRAPVR